MVEGDSIKNKSDCKYEKWGYDIWNFWKFSSHVI